MEIIQSKIQTDSRKYQENLAAMEPLVDRLAKEIQSATQEGEEKYIERHKSKGSLLARERVQHLLDDDSPFLELMALAGHGQRGIHVGASVLCGIGKVGGRACLISANIPTIRGGTINPVTVLKLKRVARIAEENRLPVISLVQSAGADLPMQSDIFNYGGSEFRNIARRSKAGIPTVAVVFGSSTAGGAYIPGLADYVIMVKERARVYLAGPPLVKMATGEDVGDEELGGAFAFVGSQRGKRHL